jgi:hypothetical protein
MLYSSAVAEHSGRRGESVDHWRLARSRRRNSAEDIGAAAASGEQRREKALFVPFRLRNRECMEQIRIRSVIGPVQKETHMFVPLSVVAGLFFVGFGISRLKTKRAAKPNVQTLFGSK